MLNAIKGFLLGFVVGCLSLTAAAYTHHVVRTADGIKVVRKSTGSLDKIFVDTRNWGAVELITNRDVVAALTRAGYDQSRQQVEQALKDGRQALERSLDDARRELAGHK
jgi:hypothetical protein